MSKLSKFDCDDCRDCLHRRVFEQGYAWCIITQSYCPDNGCEMGFNKKAANIND